MDWTTDQQKVIDLRDRNILVSAAAGSGKTAVLVERIISMISEGEEPIDIDHLLIVTFTNAAAAEMRERIGQAIEKKLENEPDNLHLQKQMMLIHTAQVTTIHSFCLFVIRNYFHTIHLDPSFRVANESELVLLKSDVIESMLEDYYEEGDEEFLHFVECFASGKTDQAIIDIILKLHNFSMSFPWPDEWLDKTKGEFDISCVDDIEGKQWMTSLKLYIKSTIEDVDNKYDELIALCKEADGPQAYLDAIDSDVKYLDKLKGLSSYEEYYEAFAGFKFKALSRKSQKEASEEKKDLAKKIRNEIKSIINDLKGQYFFQPTMEMVKDIAAMKPAMDVLIDITKEFTNAYNKKKEERNLVDFNDLEHLCLNILANNRDDKLEYSQVANELAQFYEEILIDEYQDSNLVQETILNSISKERYGRPNRFMVGDVKQSIYKFRLARPEIFMEKYEEYKSEEESESDEVDITGESADEEGAENNSSDSENDLRYQKVDLHQNFRSREIVLDTVNSVFEQIMTKKIGNIIYDDKAALYPGAKFEKEVEPVSNNTEIILVSPEKPEEVLKDVDYENLEEYEDAEMEIEDLDGKELEAKAVALRIKELVSEKDGLNILDKDGKKYRRADYKDIVILLRTMRGWADVFVEILNSEGIPSYAQTQTGYFNTLEIKTVLNMLKIIDNPRQDIPFSAILRSPIVGLNSNDIARIRMVEKDSSMYEAALSYREQYLEESKEQGDTHALAVTLDKFLIMLDNFRSMVAFLTINELIIKVLEDTGYDDFASAMPAGEKRKANIDMLIQKAIQFEETSYSGLFHFIRYIEKLHKYNVDFGEADAVSGSDNSVRIMSTHKSKGLEFPIVFVSGMGKEFNQKESSDKILIHPDLGLGPDFIDPKERTKSPTLLKKVIQKNIILENLGEEIRILYVAMTRAKEKLILTGSVKKIENRLLEWHSASTTGVKELPFYQISKAKTYLDLLIPVVLRLDSLEIFEHGKALDRLVKGEIKSPASIALNIINYNELAIRELIEQMEKGQLEDELKSWDPDHVYDEDIRNNINELMNFTYPYEAETKIHAKLTVTELKRLSQLEEEESGFRLKGIGASKVSRTPNFIQEEVTVKGANLGTLYHKILDNIDILNVKNNEELRKYLNSLYNNGNLSEEELKSINQDKLFKLLTSDVATRMRLALNNNVLYTEHQFIMGLRANEINKHMKSDELVLIQGIIDVYFEEDDELVLLDYKTDKVDPVYGESILVKRYSVQLDYYERALEQLTGKKVKERIIYSFDLEKEIRL